MIRVKDMSSKTYPQEFIDLLPHECECGADTYVTESLSKLFCNSPRCVNKVAIRLKTLLQDLGIKNMGESKCKSFLKYYGVTNPLAIFMYELEDGVLYEGCNEEFSESMFEQIDEHRDMLLWEYVRIANLPGIRDNARKLLIDYSDLEDFYDDLEDGGIEFITAKLSTKSNDDYDDDNVDSVSVRATQMYNTLMEYKEDLFEALDFVNIESLDKPILNVCISRSIGKPYKSKPEFIFAMKQEFGDKVHINELKSLSSDCNVLIWSGIGEQTSKVTTAINRIETQEENGVPYDEQLKIMTGSEFRDYLEQL